MRTIDDALALVKSTLTEKGQGYGPTYRRVAQALGVKPQYSILVRILEKALRIDNILKFDNTETTNKVLAEEFKDIAGYAILGLFESSPLED